MPHGEGRSSSAPGFSSEEGGLGGAHLAPLVPIALDSIFDADPWKLTVRGFIKWGSSYCVNSRPTDSRSAEFTRNDIPIVYLSGSSSEGGSFCYDTPFYIFHGHDIMAISFPTFQQTFKLHPPAPATRLYASFRMLAMHNFLISIVEFVSLLDCRAYSRGFPSEEGGTQRGAPRSPCARRAELDI